VVVITNALLSILMTTFSRFEHYSTWTGYDEHLAKRLALAQFLNTSMITFCVAFVYGDWFGPSGLVINIYNVFQMNAIVPTLTALIDVGWVVRWWKRRSLRNQGTDCFETQEQANITFEEPEFDLSIKYAGIVKTIYSTAFYAAILPTAIPWCIIALAGQYWTDKFAFLRKSSKVRSIGADLAKDMLTYLEYFLFIYAFGNFCFTYLFFPEDQIALGLATIGMAVGLINAILPLDTLAILFPSTKTEPIIEKTYEELKYNFEEDYDRCNPATRDDAIQKYLREKAKAGSKL